MVATDDTRADPGWDPGWAVESALCLDFELEQPDVDDGRARSLLSCGLGECHLADSALGDPWRLDHGDDDPGVCYDHHYVYDGDQTP